MEIIDMIRENISRNYTKYRDISYKFSNGIDESDDILQETLLNMLQLSEISLSNIAKKIKNDKLYINKYIVKTIKLSFISKTSKYQCKYNRLLITDDINILENEIIDEYDPSIDEKYNIINTILIEECSYYEESVFREKAGGKSLNQIGKECDIPITHLWKTYTNVLKKIRIRYDKKVREQG